MGHQRLGSLPRSREWQQVIALISEGANVETIAAATSRAAEISMVDAGADPAVRYAFWFLTQIPLAARQDDFEPALRKLGVKVDPHPSLAAITSGMMDAIDGAVSRLRARNDFSDISFLCVGTPSLRSGKLECSRRFRNSGLVRDNQRPGEICPCRAGHCQAVLRSGARLHCSFSKTASQLFPQPRSFCPRWNRATVQQRSRASLV